MQPRYLSYLTSAAVALSYNFAIAVNSSPSKEKVATILANIDIPFEENRGQTDAKVAFYARTLAGPLFVTKTGELVWSLPPPDASLRPDKPDKLKPPAAHKLLAQDKFVGPPRPSYSVVEKFVGGAAKPSGAKPAATAVSYFHGNDRSKWQYAVFTFNQVSLGEVWPGITVEVAARGKNAEKLFTIAPGADANKIAVEVAGGNLQIAVDGGLRVQAPAQPLLSFTAPIAYQEIDGQRNPVQVAYRIHGTNRYGFTLGKHDATQPVVIDPLLQSTYLGGSKEDRAYVLAVTADSVYVAGSTLSLNFPGTLGGMQDMAENRWESFVAQLTPNLKTLVQTTYLGGNDEDWALDLAVTPSSLYITGYTESSNFPGTTDGLQATKGGSSDIFVAVLTPDLKQLIQATYLGGSDSEDNPVINLKSDTLYVAGSTESNNFPGTIGGAQPVRGGKIDVFVAKVAPDLKSLIQATYLGGTGNEASDDSRVSLAVTTNDVYIATNTVSTNFPGTSGGAQATKAEDRDAVIARLSSDLKTLLQATYLGGNGEEWVSLHNLALTSNDVYIAGRTSSLKNFPGTVGGAQPLGNDGTNVFVARLTLNLKTLIQATHLGNGHHFNAVHTARSIIATTDGLYIAGIVESRGSIPNTAGGTQPSRGGGDWDAFLTKLALDLTSFTQSTYLGGSHDDSFYAMTILPNSLYAAGYTKSKDFPGTYRGAQATYGTGGDAVVARMTPDLLAISSNYGLMVNKTGTGSGTVTSNPGGINCGTDCSANFAVATNVTLTATATNGSTFNGWSGDAECANGQVNMNTAINCTATFASTSVVTTALESPQQGSYESGIGLVRGWACQANKIEVQIDNGVKRQVAYGTARGDTQATCGHANTGFGYTYNWNVLSNGTHNLKAFADNVQFADVNFTTTNLGTSYLTGANGQYTLENFPATGKSATLKWSEPHQNFVISNATRTSPRIGPPQTRNGMTGNLESPQSGSYESGIALIRGWMCQANKIEVQINNGTKRQVAYGTARGDTASRCNGNPNTGFGFVYNWNGLGDGNHNLRLLVDDQEFTNVTFTVTTLGGNYLEGLSREETLPNFPSSGRNVKVRWATPHQNFVMVP
jgi:hypothetical protein